MRTREQERDRKRRSRERQRSGEWFALVDVKSSILSMLVLLDLVGRQQLHDRAAIKAAIGTLVHRYTEGKVDRLEHIEPWKYRDPLTPSGKSVAQKKRAQRCRRRDGRFMISVLITNPLVAALVRDGYVSDGQDRAAITEGLALMLWELASCAAMPINKELTVPHGHSQSLPDDMVGSAPRWGELIQPLRAKLLLILALRAQHTNQE